MTVVKRNAAFCSRLWISSPYSKGHPDLLSNGSVYVSIACFREASQTLIDKIRCPHQFCHIHGRSAWLNFGSKRRWVFQGQRFWEAPVSHPILVGSYQFSQLQIDPLACSPCLSKPGRLGWFQGKQWMGLRLQGWAPPKKMVCCFLDFFRVLRPPKVVEENPTSSHKRCCRPAAFVKPTSAPAEIRIAAAWKLRVSKLIIRGVAPILASDIWNLATAQNLDAKGTADVVMIWWLSISLTQAYTHANICPAINASINPTIMASIISCFIRLTETFLCLQHFTVGRDGHKRHNQTMYKH